MCGVWRQLVSEFAGTATLVCVVVGSGIMGDRLSSDDGISLFINCLSTVLALAILILILMPVSGAHLNPAVSLVATIRRQLSLGRLASFIGAQVSGAIVGAIVANFMFNLAVVSVSSNDRVTVGTLVGEVIAVAGLVLVIEVLVARAQQRLLPVAVAAWIGSACFFTSSTSFANPAVTIGRMFSDSFAGIAPTSVAPYVAAQVFGALLGLLLVTLVRPSASRGNSRGDRR